MAELKCCDMSFPSHFDLLLVTANVSPLLATSWLFRAVAYTLPSFQNNANPSEWDGELLGAFSSMLARHTASST